MMTPLSRMLSLPPQLERYVAEAVDAGDFPDEQALLLAAIERMRADGPVSDVDTWLIGGGECGQRVRDIDWSASPLGAIGGWPSVLRTTVANIVHSPIAKVLMWGPDHVMIYNDAYRSIAGPRHPEHSAAWCRRYGPRSGTGTATYWTAVFAERTSPIATRR